MVKVMQVQMARVCRRESANWDHRQLKVADWRNPFTNGVDTGKQARQLGLHVELQCLRHTVQAQGTRTYDFYLGSFT